MTENKQLAPKTTKDLVLDDKGLPVIKNVGDRIMLAESLLRSGMLPKSYKSAAEVASAMQMAAEVGMKPGITTLRRTANINGTPSFFGELPLAVVQASGNLAHLETYYFDKDGNKIHPANRNLHAPIEGFFIEGKRKDNGVVHYEYYTVTMANKAGLGPVWKKHPEDMLKWRAVGKWVKTLFGDLLGGASIAEYDHNTYVTTEDENPKSQITSTESGLNGRFEEEAATVAGRSAGVGGETNGEAPNEGSAYIETTAKEVGTPATENGKRVPDSKSENGSERRSHEDASDINARFSQQAGGEVLEEIQPDGGGDGPAQQLESAADSQGEQRQSAGNSAGPGEYVVPLGKHQGKRLSQIAMPDLLETRGKLEKHISATHGGDATVSKYLENVNSYLEATNDL